MKHRAPLYVCLIALGAMIVGSSTTQAQLRYTEDFTTNAYKDVANTTADWNTAAGELRLFPFMITSIGSYDTPGNAFHVVVSGDLAFVADDPDVVIFDITDPANPTSMGTFAAGDAQAVFYAGDLLYVAAGTSGLTIVDISDPTNPTQVGNLNTPAQALDVVVEGDVAYVANQVTGLVVVDVSDPTTPVQIGLYNTPNQAHGVDVSGDHCYVADRGSSGVIVLDVSDPTAPTLTGGLVMPGDTWNIDIDGDLAYVSDAGANGLGLAILDVGDPTNPTLLGSVDPGTVRNIDVSGDVVYAAGNTDIHAIDVSDPTNPIVLESWTTPGIASAIAVAGEHAYIADGTVGGLQVLSVRHVVPSPIEIGFTATFGDGNGIAVAGDYAFVAEGYSGLRVIDISNLASPFQIGLISTSFYAHDVAVAGFHAFVADDVSGLRVIDISNPGGPVEIGFNNTPGYARGVALAGDHAFVADSDSGLRVVDISHPSGPVEIGFIDTPGSATRVTVTGDHAFVVDGDSGLRVIDISNPAVPVEIAFINTPGYARGVAVAGDHAFVTDNVLGGLRVIDISNPSAPAEVGFIDTPGKTSDVTVVGDHAFAAGYLSGIRVFQIFPRDYDTKVNRGQSLAVDSGSDPILRTRLTTSQTNTVSWELSTDAGANWQVIVPDGAWNGMMPGTDLLWRSTHVLTVPGGNPAVSDLTLEWLGASGIVSAIEDVPDDQGGWVRVNFMRSGYDFSDETTNPATGYQIYQRVDAALAARVRSLVASTTSPRTVHVEPLPGVDPAHVRFIGERRFVPGGADAAGMFPPGTWEAVGWVAATQSDSYTARVSTTADSTSAGINWSVYLVTTHTTSPSAWFVSAPDSGYSVDNIAPGVPQSFAIAYNTGSGNTLTWDDAPEPDFQYYRVYRSTDPDFTPTPAELVHETATPLWSDPDYDGGIIYYKVTALDHAGNESDPTDARAVTAVDNPPAPARLALHGNAPNPFNPSTVIRYDVPPTGAAVEIIVFDALGRHMRTLVSGAVSGGNHHVTWDGRNDRGQSVAAGMYFYRMRTGSFVDTRKMLLVK